MVEHDNVDMPLIYGKMLDLRNRHNGRKSKSKVNRPTWLSPVARGVTLRTGNGSPVMRSSVIASFTLLGERGAGGMGYTVTSSTVASMRTSVAKVLRNPTIVDGVRRRRRA